MTFGQPVSGQAFRGCWGGVGVGGEDSQGHGKDDAKVAEAQGPDNELGDAEGKRALLVRAQQVLHCWHLGELGQNLERGRRRSH